MQGRSSVIQAGRQAQAGRAHGATTRRPSVVAAAASPSGAKKEVTLLDYGAGNVRSVRNAIYKLGFSIKEVRQLARQEREQQ